MRVFEPRLPRFLVMHPGVTWLFLHIVFVYAFL
jgi:hypothetical protein